MSEYVEILKEAEVVEERSCELDISEDGCSMKRVYGKNYICSKKLWEICEKIVNDEKNNVVLCNISQISIRDKLNEGIFRPLKLYSDLDSPCV